MTKRQHRCTAKNALSTVTFNLIASKAKALARGLDFSNSELFSVIYDGLKSKQGDKSRL